MRQKNSFCLKNIHSISPEIFNQKSSPQVGAMYFMQHVLDGRTGEDPLDIPLRPCLGAPDNQPNKNCFEIDRAGQYTVRVFNLHGGVYCPARSICEGV